MINDLVCETCDRQFNNYHAAFQHRQALGHWECECCTRVFGSEDDAEDHMDGWGHRSNRWCFDCNRGFESVNNYNQHRNSRLHRGTDIKCPFCRTAFVSASGVSHHLETGSCTNARTVNRDVIAKELRQRDVNSTFTNKLLEWNGDPSYEATEQTWNPYAQAYECYLCHKRFNSLKGLDQHLASPRHASKLYHCPSRGCVKLFVSLAALFNHLESESCGYVRFEQVQQNVSNFFASGRTIAFK